MLPFSHWQNFYLLVGTASATLIGLLFVAISLGSSIPAPQAHAYIRTFVTPIFLVYAQVVFVSCLALVPGDNMFLLSGMLVLLGVFDLILTGNILRRIRVVHRGDDDIENGYWLWYLLLPGMVSLLLIASAPGLFLDAPLTIPVLALVVLLSLALGLRNTWNLLLWLVMRHGMREAESKPL